MRKSLLSMLLGILLLVAPAALNAQTHLLKENFETVTSGSDLPNGWRASGTAHYQWQITALSTVDHALVFDGRYGYNYAESTSLLLTPTLNLSGGHYFLSFRYKNTALAIVRVCVTTNSGGTLSAPLFESSYDTKVEEYQTIELDLGPWTGQTIQVAVYAESTGIYERDPIIGPKPPEEGGFAYIDDFKVDLIPACADVIQIYPASITATTVDLTYAVSAFGSIPTAYDVTIKDANYNTIRTVSSSSSSTQITGLNPGTKYYAYVRSNCQSTQQGVGAMSDKCEFVTITAPQDLPLVEDFNNSKDMPYGWRGATDAYYDTYLQKVMRKGNVGYAAALNAGSAGAALVSPALNHAANDIELTFSYYAVKPGRYTVGLLSDVADMTTMEYVYSAAIPAEKTGTWQDVIVNTGASVLGAQTGAHLCIINNASGTTLYIEDVNIHVKPACPEIVGFQVESVDSTSARLSWEIFGSTSPVEIEVATGGNLDTVIAYGNGHTLTLTASTTYTVRARMHCNATDYTPWTEPVTFTTNCSTKSVPFLDSFDAADSFLNCWSTIAVSEGANPSTAITRNTSSSYNKTGAGSLKMTLQGENLIAVVSPALYIPTAGAYDLRFSFYRTNYSTNYQNLKVLYNTVPSVEGAVELETIAQSYKFAPTEDATSSGEYFTYDYNLPVSGVIYIIFVGESIDSYSSYYPMYIDDVEIKTATTCRKPSKVKAGAVGRDYGVIEWQEGTPGAQYYVTYSIAGQNGDTLVAGTSLRFDSLAQATNYTVTGTIAGVCGANDTSEVVSFSVSFTTSCTPVSALPYTQDFEACAYASSTSTFPACWDRVVYTGTATGAQGFRIGTTASNAHGGSKYLSFYDCASGKAMYLNMGGYVIPSQGGIFSIWARRINNTGNPTVDFYACPAPGDIANGRKLFTAERSTTEPTGWYKYEAELPAGTWYIVADGTLIYTYADFFFDDMEVKLAPNCKKFTDIEVSNIGDTYATIKAPITSDQGWEYYVGTSATLDVNNTTQSLDAEVQLTGLQINTTYYVHARRLCQDDEMSDWTDAAVSFTTLACTAFNIDLNAAFVDNFETTPLNNCYITTSNSGSTNFSIVDSIEITRAEPVVNIKPYAGSKMLKLSTQSSTDQIDADMYRFVHLTSGTNYVATVYAVAALDSNTTAAQTHFTFALYDEMGGRAVTTFANNVNLDTQWKEYKGYFTVSETGDYFLGMKFNCDTKYRPCIGVDSLSVVATECIPPISITASEITTNSAKVTLSSNADSWEVKISDSDNNSGNIFNQTVTDPVINLTNLAENTTYYVTVRSNCETFTSVWSEVITFHTKCGVQNLPIDEDFEDPTLHNFGCWIITGNGVTERSTKVKYHGLASLATSNNMIVSPELNVTSLAGYTLNGFVYTDEVAGSQLSIGVMLDPDDVSTYEELLPVRVGAKGRWIEFTVDLSVLNSDDYAEFAAARYIAIIPEGSVQYYFDDISIAPTPVCGKPANAYVADVTATTANIYWTSTASEFEVTVYGTDPLIGDTVVVSAVTTQMPFAVSGLKHHQTYWAEVAAICSVGDTTRPSFVDMFQTLCDNMPTPWVENFEDVEMDLNDQCFNLVHSEDDVPYTIMNKEYQLLEGNYSLEIRSGAKDIFMILPPMADPLTDLKLEFMYRYLLAKESYPSIELGLVNDNSGKGQFNVISTFRPSVADNEIRVILSDVVTAADANKILAFRIKGGNPGAIITIDNIRVVDKLECIDIKGKDLEFTKEGNGDVVASWKHESATNYAFEVYLDGVKVIDSTVNANSVVLTGLAANTEYVFRVRPLCDATHQGDWTASTFRTNPLVTPLPYSTTFNNAEDNEGWFLECGSQGNQFYFGNQPGSNSLFVGYTNTSGTLVHGTNTASTSTPNYMIYAYRTFYLAEGEYKLTYSCQNQSNSAKARILLIPTSYQLVAGVNSMGIVPNASSATSADNIPLDVIQADGALITTGSQNAAAQNNLTNSFRVAKAGYYYLAVCWYRYRTQSSESRLKPFYLTKVQLEAQICSQATNVTATNVEATEAQLHVDVTAAVGELSYMINTENDFATATEGIAYNGSTINLKNLTPLTTYHVWVTPTCSRYNNDVPWAYVTFTTPRYEHVQTLPYSTGFETAEERDTWILNNTANNALKFGSDPNGVNSGSFALYPSFNDSTYKYSTQTAAMNMAYTMFNLEPGRYTYSYNYRAKYHDVDVVNHPFDPTHDVEVESTDYGSTFARLLLVPANVALNSYADCNVAIETGETYCEEVEESMYSAIATENTVGSGIIALDGGARLEADTWQQFSGEFSIAAEGKYRLVLLWVHNMAAWQAYDYDCMQEVEDNDGTWEDYEACMQMGYFDGQALAIDNLNLALAETLCAAPTGVQLDGIAGNAARFVFDNPDNRKVYYAYSTSNSTSIAPQDSTTGNSVTITGLNGTTTYYFFVATECDGARTAWVRTQFATPCADFTTVTKENPYFYGFEDQADNQVLTGCWTTNQTTASKKPVAFNILTGDAALGTCYSGAKAAKFPTPTAKQDSRLTHTFFLEAGKSYTIKAQMGYFYNSTFGTYTADLSLVIGQNNTFTKVQTYTVTFSRPSEPVWNQFNYDFTPTQSGLYEIGAVIYLPTAVGFGILDDFTVEINDIPAPKDADVSVDGNHAIASWSGSEQVEMYEVQLLDADGDILTTDSVTLPSWDMGNLSFSKNYTFRVRSIAGELISGWAGVDFVTNCGAANPPYYLTFEGAGIDPMCWTKDAVADSYAGWRVEKDNAGFGQFKYRCYSGAYAPLHEVNLYSPGFVIDKEGYTMKFRYSHITDHSATDIINIGISLDGSTIHEMLVSTDDNVADVQVTKVLNDYAGQTIYLIVRGLQNDPSSYWNTHYLEFYGLSITCFGGEHVNNVTLCTGDIYEDQYFSVRASDLAPGTYQYQYFEVAEEKGECDNIHTLNLTVGNTVYQTILDTICNTVTYNKNGFSGLSEPGTYQLNLPSATGCDSIIRLTLFTVPDTKEIYDTICEGDVRSFGGQTYTTSGNYVAAIPSNYGCDITTTLHLTVIPREYVHTHVICESSPISWEGQTYNQTGVYRVNHTSKNGCDSIEVLDLTVLPTNVEIEASICAGGSYRLGDTVLTTAGVYQRTLINSLWCDSIVTLTLTVDDPIVNVINDFTCEGQPYYSYGFDVDEVLGDTILERTVVNVDGCDSMIRVIVEFIPTEYVNDTVQIHEGEVYEWGGGTYAQAGDYEHKFVSELGCDSVVYLHLDVIVGVENAYTLPVVLAPNPIRTSTSTYVMRDWTEAERQGMRVYVLSSVGQIVNSFEPTSFPIEINRLYTTGVYYVRVLTGTGETYVGKLVVK